MNTNLSALMENFQKQLSETTKTVKETVAEMTPQKNASPDKKSPKAKK